MIITHVRLGPMGPVETVVEFDRHSEQLTLKVFEQIERHRGAQGVEDAYNFYLSGCGRSEDRLAVLYAVIWTMIDRGTACQEAYLACKAKLIEEARAILMPKAFRRFADRLGEISGLSDVE